MAINIPTPDSRYILEDENSVNGNVLTNDVDGTNTTEDVLVIPGSVESEVAAGDVNGVVQGKYGTLQINSDGTYTYTLTEDMNYLGAGVDVEEKFTYTVEKADGSGDDTETLTITVHGENDKVMISDVVASTYEGGDHAGDVEIFSGQFKLEDLDPDTDGDQVDLDNGDDHTFKYVTNSLNVESSDVDKTLLTGVDVTVNADGTYSVTGDFDALSAGDTAVVTFEYQVEETSDNGNGEVSLSDPKTVTLTVIGTNDDVEIKDDTIVTYDQLIDGDIYKSILANDGHYDPANGTYPDDLAKDIDVNDKLSIVSTGYHDLQFWQNGGQISVDNAAQTLEYTPGSGGAIAKDHFSFYYQATDGNTDPIGSAVANFEMVNKNDVAIDFYQFGAASDDTVCGIDGSTNVLSGMSGNDYIEGKELGDILYGGEGQDVLQGGWGDDIYKGGAGNDGIVDTRGNDTYVFSKGDGRDTIDDLNLEIYTDAAGHETINWNFWNNEDVVYFDDTVDKSQVAIYQEKGTEYDSLIIKYSDNPDDIVSIGWDQENHYGIETIEFADGSKITESEINAIIDAIATTDIDPNTAGTQLAQDVHDVQNSKILMDMIATYV